MYKNKYIRRAFSLFWLLFLTNYVMAQYPTVLLEVGASPTTYFGELSNGIDKWDASFHAGVRFNRMKKVNLRLGILVGNIADQDREFESSVEGGTPNTFFKTQLLGGYVEFLYHLMNKKNMKLSLTQGIGLLRFIPKDENFDPLSDQVNTRAVGEEYGTNTLMLPTGIAFMYLFPNGFAAGSQVGLLNTMTDYLDNISELGESGIDNVFQWRFSFFAPLSFKENGKRRRRR